LDFLSDDISVVPFAPSYCAQRKQNVYHCCVDRSNLSTYHTPHPTPRKNREIVLLLLLSHYTPTPRHQLKMTHNDTKHRLGKNILKHFMVCNFLNLAQTKQLNTETIGYNRLDLVYQILRELHTFLSLMSEENPTFYHKNITPWQESHESPQSSSMDPLLSSTQSERLGHSWRAPHHGIW
jgi:hypothetical protein